MKVRISIALAFLLGQVAIAQSSDQSYLCEGSGFRAEVQQRSFQGLKLSLKDSQGDLLGQSFGRVEQRQSPQKAVFRAELSGGPIYLAQLEILKSEACAAAEGLQIQNEDFFGHLTLHDDEEVFRVKVICSAQ